MKIDTNRPIVKADATASIPVINAAGHLCWKIVKHPVAEKFRIAYRLNVMEI